MAKTPRPWIVTRHDPIQKLEDNLWTVAGDIPGLKIGRRMCIVKQTNGNLLFFNAIPLADEALAEVLAWGRPSALVVPHHQHMIDAHAFVQKLGLELYGPAACAAAMRKRGPMTGTLEDVPRDDSVDIRGLAGTKFGEAVITVRSGERTSLLFGDAIQNTPAEALNPPLRWLGFGGGPKVVPVFKLLFVADKPRFKAQLAELSELPQLARVVPAHGTIVGADAAAALSRAGSTA